MAKMIPEIISASESATAGEKKLFKILKYNLPNDYIVGYKLERRETCRFNLLPRFL